MVCKSKFSELAQRVIKNYYREFAGSLQNSSHSQALLYAQKTEKLRINFLNYLGISDSHLASIQPNKHYLEKIILNFLNLESQEWEVFTNCSNWVFNDFCTFSLQEFLGKDEITKVTFVYLDSWIVEPSLISQISQKLIYFQERGQIVYSYLISKDLEKLNQKLLKCFSFICYDPSEELSEFGSVLFGFSKTLKLKPVFLGSGGATFVHQSNVIQLKKTPSLLEIGTQNLIFRLIFAEYLEKISQN